MLELLIISTLSSTQRKSLSALPYGSEPFRVVLMAEGCSLRFTLFSSGHIFSCALL